jgi:PST family polysaccharide transporter
MYVGVIIGSMGADFYPRLTAAAKDNIGCNRLVNEQTQVGILLAAPGVIATLTFAPLVVAVFYSAEFQEAVEVLRWLCLGMALRVISWPMGYIILAKGARSLFLGAEMAWTAVYVGLAWLCVNAFGLNGAGIAFFVSSILHVLMIYLMVRQLSRFQWSVENIKIIELFISIMVLVFLSFYWLSYPLAMAIGIFALLASSVYSIRSLLHLAPVNLVPRPILKVLEWFRLVEVASRC